MYCFQFISEKENLTACISESTRNWDVQHWFLSADVASFKCKNNFLTRGCNRSSKKVSGSWTND